jgi:tartrate dehydrogenase/decarboxylase / D-malate dehydrogenase
VATFRLALIPGDGIGPEVVNEGVRLIERVTALGGPRFEMESYAWGSGHYLEHGEIMPPDGLDRLAAVDAILLGAIGDPRVPEPVSVRGLVIRVRQAFEQYVNLRPVRLLPGVRPVLAGKTPEDIRFTVIRENTEGEYAAMGGRIHRGTPYEAATETSYFSRRGIERVARYAFELAKRDGLGVTSVTKSNAMPNAMAFWDEVVAEVHEEFPGVPLASILVDAAAMFMVRQPERFGVVVTTNLFGDILTDLGAAIQGGMGLAAGANLDPTRRHPSMFEPIHGSAPDIAGKGIANPMATFWAISMMYDHLGAPEWGAAVLEALAACLREGRVRTPDLGGADGTAAVGQAVVEALQAPSPL